MADDKAEKSPPGSKPSSPPRKSASPSATKIADDEAGKSPPGSMPSSPPGSNPASPPPATNPVTPNSTGLLPAEHWAQQPIEDDAESLLAESLNTSTASISSSILNYRTLHGRQYHSEVGNAAYWGSNDEQQSESMDINHYALTLGLGDKLFLAPLDKDKVQRVLDIGTGTGIWAIDFADEYPEVEVIGTDISPIQPGWVPPNLKFEIEDCTRDWTFKPDSFDYVHLRWLTGSIADWDSLFEQAFKVTKPGGWVESHETSSIFRSDHVTISDDSAVAQWSMIFHEGGKTVGRNFNVVDDDVARKAMEAAGFVDIQEYTYKNPMGGWPKDPVLKEIGNVTMAALGADIEGYILFMANALGWSREEIQVYIAHLRRDLLSNRYYPYYWQKVVWGRKPE